MLRRWMSVWKQWFNGTQHPSKIPLPPTERRVWVRYPCRVATSCQPDHAQPDTIQLSAKVQDVSRGGINLLVDRRLEAGRQLLVELPDTKLLPSAIVMANLVRATPTNAGEWVLGCTFASELTQDDLEPFGARLVRPEATDKRVWVRFATDAQGTYQIMRTSDRVRNPCRAVNLSAGGIALEVGRYIDIGTTLNLEVRAANGRLTLSLLAGVVRVQVRDGQHSLVGCNFIRELTDNELQAWLAASAAPAETVTG